ncbi:MAG: methyltransferase RsmF C-terminal domain-like protein [Bacteroidales bacterium]
MNLPADFIALTSSILSEKEHTEFINALSTEAPISIRINRTKATPSECGIREEYDRVPWSESGYYLPERPAFTFDPLLHAGCYYVQEASSMFLEQAITQYVKSPVVYLDLCAAPGGKTTHAISLLPKGSLVIGNEIMRNRANILAENLTKWGNTHTIVTNNPSEDFTSLANTFDVILTDVPCSGEGMFRKDPVAIEEWSLSNVEMCTTRQRDIISNIWPTLKPGGLLIYSTCTYNSSENEDNIDWIVKNLGAESLEIDTTNFPQVVKALKNNNHCYRFMPHHTTGEGFFLALLRKPQEEELGDGFERSRPSKKKDKKREESIKIPSEISNWIIESDKYQMNAINQTISAIPKEYFELYKRVKEQLRIVKAGIEMCEIKGKDLIPAHSLAMSNKIKREYFNEVELERESAIRFLRKEAITLDDDQPRGYILVTYKSKPLGWVKNIGNRANNLYPQEWRIRSGYIPEQ